MIDRAESRFRRLHRYSDAGHSVYGFSAHISLSRLVSAHLTRLETQNDDLASRPSAMAAGAANPFQSVLRINKDDHFPGDTFFYPFALRGGLGIYHFLRLFHGLDHKN